MAKRLNETQLNGCACVVCGGDEGSMVACNTAEESFYGRKESQLFGHLACLELDPNLRTPGETEKKWALDSAERLLNDPAEATVPQHLDDPRRPGYCTCRKLAKECPVNPRKWHDPECDHGPNCIDNYNPATRLLDDLKRLMKLSREGKEITLHHLVSVHADVLELLHEIGGYEDIIEQYRL